MKHDIKIIKTGSFFDIDSQGYIINPASDNKIQEKWRPAIEYIINAYKEEFGNKLKNVYVRGSVSKGMALENISDLDMFAYVHLEKEEISSEWSKKLQEKFIAKYSFINGVDIMTKPVSLESKGGILLNQSLCVFGEKTKVEKLKIGKDLILHTPGLQKRFVLFEKFKENNNDKEILEHCVFQMKGILRVGLEILIERSGKYSRDLYPCYEVFGQYYPEKEQEMREVLYLALNPTSDLDKIEKIISGIGKWLLVQIDKLHN